MVTRTRHALVLTLAHLKIKTGSDQQCGRKKPDFCISRMLLPLVLPSRSESGLERPLPISGGCHHFLNTLCLAFPCARSYADKTQQLLFSQEGNALSTDMPTAPSAAATGRRGGGMGAHARGSILCDSSNRACWLSMTYR